MNLIEKSPKEIRDLISRIEAEQELIMRNLGVARGHHFLFFKLSRGIRREINQTRWSVPTVAGGRAMMEQWARYIEQI